MSEIINAFPGYEFVYDPKDKEYHNMYRGTDVGKGGYVYAKPGMYGNIALLDVQSMHPASLIAMNCFGEYTKNFQDLRDARVAIKHKNYDTARTMLNGRLAPYLDDESTAKELAQALKISINSVFGLTCAKFPNPMRDDRNKNNIVALRGALMMRTLQDEVETLGYPCAHIKTDSCKIPDATPEVIEFVQDFATKYNYIMELEAIYDRICLVNNAVYIAKYSDDPINGKLAGTWTATGTQFQVPYVFKKLFSKEEIVFDDLCETKEVKTALYLDMNEKLPEGEHDYHFIGKVGLFCPIKPGCGGGELRVKRTDKEGNVKYDSATGADGYRWLEAEQVKLLGKEDDIDRSYYDKLVNDAVDAISKYGDFEWFVSDDPYIPGMLGVDPRRELDDTPPWKLSCGRETCEGCPNLFVDEFHMSCELGHDIQDLPYINAREEDARAFDRR